MPKQNMTPQQWRIQRGAHGARAPPPSHFLIHYLKATTLTAN